MFCFALCLVPAQRTVIQSSVRQFPTCSVSQLELPLKTEAPREIKAAAWICLRYADFLPLKPSPDEAPAIIGILTVG